MSHFDSLIREHCPEGVPFVPLGSLGTWCGGGTPSKSRPEFWRDGTIPWVSPKDMGRPFVNSAQDHITVAAVRASATKLVASPAIVMVVRSSILDHTFPTALTSVPVALNQDMKAVVPDDRVLPRYLAHVLRANGQAILRTARKTGGSVASIDSGKLLSFRVPVPPLVVQREIVRILDHFTELEAELEAEMEARRTQRTALTNNLAVAVRDDVHERTQPERVRLGEIARESVEPVRVHAEHLYASLGVKWNGEGVLSRDPRPGNSIKATTLHRAHPGQLIYNRMFVVEGSFALVPDECGHAVVSGEFPLFELDESRVEPRWLLQHLCDPYTLKRIEAEVTGTERGSMKSRRRWKADQFREFEIQLPSLEEQRRTVAVLQASTDLLASLRKEIAARQKQHQYYRDKLLTFDEKQ